MSNLCLDCEKGGKIDIWLFTNISNRNDGGLRMCKGGSGGKDRAFVELNKINANKIGIIRELTLLIKQKCKKVKPWKKTIIISML